MSFGGFDLGGEDLEDRDGFLGLDRGPDDEDVRIRLKLREDRYGYRARFRGVEPFESVELRYERREDVPSLLGLGRARDRLYDWLGREPKRRGQSDRVGLSVGVDEHWGFWLSYQEDRDPGDPSDPLVQTGAAGVGFRPFGRNEGRRWNLGLGAGLSHSLSRRLARGFRESERDWAWSCGAALDCSLDDLAMPWDDGIPERGRGRLFWLDKVSAELGYGDSLLADYAFRGAVQLRAQLTRHLRLRIGYGFDWIPGGEEGFEHGPTLGLGVKF